MVYVMWTTHDQRKVGLELLCFISVYRCLRTAHNIRNKNSGYPRDIVDTLLEAT